MALAAAVLRGEPRSVYRRTKCSAESYGFSLDGVDIVTECGAPSMFVLFLLFDANGQGKSVTVKTLVQVRSLPVCAAAHATTTHCIHFQKYSACALRASPPAPAPLILVASGARDESEATGRQGARGTAANERGTADGRRRRKWWYQRGSGSGLREWGQ